MSHLVAKVSQIQSCENLHIVNFECHSQTLSMMSLNLDKKIEVGKSVKLLVKPTHIAIAKKFSGELSYSNQLNCMIKSIENGELLSSITLDFSGTILESIITVASSKKMNLQIGDKVTAFIKASELSIKEIIDV